MRWLSDRTVVDQADRQTDRQTSRHTERHNLPLERLWYLDSYPKLQL